MKRKRRKFTKEFKEEAVKLVLEEGYQISEDKKTRGRTTATNCSMVKSYR